MSRPFAAIHPESALVPRTVVAAPVVRPLTPPVYGPYGRGVAAPIASVRGFSPSVSAPSLARIGGGHYFSPPVGARAQMPVAVGVQPFLGGMRGR
jgi:hypothetical protein